jgi:hypothetical protein
VFSTYICRNCAQTTKTFALLFEFGGGDAFEVMKLGEYPPFGAPVADRIKKLLGDRDLELYRKGMRCIAQGLGVGAASYFRRIVDNQWKLLVREIRDAAAKLGQTDLSVFDQALQETQFSAAVDLLKDSIPPKLLILDDQNPLTLLYKPLSVQLHDLSDDECLQEADDIRIVLTTLLENLSEVLRDHDQLKNAANRLKRGKT